MSENTKIEWATHTFNPWRGVHATLADGSAHPGCEHCYAETLSKRNPGTLGVWGADGTRVMASAAQWKQPLKWNAAAEKAGVRARVFCASLADVFEDWEGPISSSDGDEYRACEPCGWWGLLPVIKRELGPQKDMRDCPSCGARTCRAGISLLRRHLFALIDATPWLDWLLLTKRPENIRRMWRAVDVNMQQQADDRNERGELYRRNVWLLTSVRDQPTADALIPELLKCRDLAPVLGLSCEPLLGPVDLDNASRQCLYELSGEKGIDWVIIGGESGHGARPCNVRWVRDIRDQCQAAGVPVFIKQLGACIGVVNDRLEEFPNDGDVLACLEPDDVQPMQGETWRYRLKDKKGGDWNEWPADLRVREFPSVLSLLSALGVPQQ